jgi:hypothetical protein
MQLMKNLEDDWPTRDKVTDHRADALGYLILLLSSWDDVVGVDYRTHGFQ